MPDDPAVLVDAGPLEALCDQADAALGRIAEREGLRTIFTLDHRGFRAYRLPRGRPFLLIPESVG
jgi:hypothetical protein